MKSLIKFMQRLGQVIALEMGERLGYSGSNLIPGRSFGTRIREKFGTGLMGRILLQPIGRVRNSIHIQKRDGWELVTSQIILKEKYEEALEGVEDYSHLLILFWITRIPKSRREMRKVHPRSREDLPLVGIFATRTQYRPNPIGLTLVQLLGRRKNILRVRGLDALDGTPVLDIKPISPVHEFPERTRVPEWYHRLWPQKRRRTTRDR